MTTQQTRQRNSYPFPDDVALERMGFVKCNEDDCTVHVDPANVPELRCAAHQKLQRSQTSDHLHRAKR